MKKLVGALCVALLVAGCGGGGSSGSTRNGGGSGGGGQPFGLDSRATPSAVQIPISASASTSLRAVDAGMGRQFGTTTLTHAGDGSDRLFVAWGGGVIRIHNRNGTAPIDFLDIMDRVDTTTGEYDKESATIRKGYHKSKLSKLKHY